MPNSTTNSSGFMYYNNTAPTASEPSVRVGNWFLNTATNNLFLCKDSTFGAQVWDEYPTATVSVAKGGTGAVTLTGVLTGNGTSAVTANTVTQYGTVVAGASNAVSSVAPSATSGVPFISQGAASNPTFGTAVVAGGGTGATTLTDHGVLVGSGTSPIDALSVGATGTVLAGTTGADPAFTATPSVTSVAIGAGGLTITSGAGAPGSTQPKGSLYLRSDGGGVNDRMYVATDGAGTWTAVVTVA